MPVAARYHQIRDRVLAGVDKAFAEPIRIAPFKKGAVDDSRAAIEIEAVLRGGGGKNTSVTGGSGRSWRSRIMAGKAELHIDRAKYPDLVVRPGDEIRALSRQGQPYWEVLAIDDRDLGRLVLQLGETT